ncbi:MAG: SGNH/GDSL hydrolase family protein [Phycisphaerae bacterium]
MLSRRAQTLVAVGLLAGNVVAWLIPSNVLTLVAREQAVLLGRYSRPHLLWLITAGAATLVALLMGSAADARARRLRAFKLVSVTTFGLLAFLAADVALRFFTPLPYVLDRVAYRRPASAVIETTYDDRPAPGCVYPADPPGFGRVVCRLSTDRNGFRNGADRAACDVVALGDSFTEGSRVTDGDPWPARLERELSRSVVNLGVSGYSPQHCAAAWADFGAALHPRDVVLLLYEGNDFRAVDADVRKTVSLKKIIRTSPILAGLERLLVDRLGAINRGAAARRLDLLSWMPIALPASGGVSYYAFAPKQLLDLYGRATGFEQSREWQVARQTLGELHDACARSGARLTIAYAPVKARVIVPLVADQLPGEKVRAFLSLRSRRLLPPATELMADLLAGLDRTEAVVRDWCAAQRVEFVSLTQPLRRAAAAGRQTYYTYDQHWTPIGHAVAAETIAAALREVGSGGTMARRAAADEGPPGASSRPAADSGQAAPRGGS